MQPEYYRPSSNLISTIALFSSIGLAAPCIAQHAYPVPVRYTVASSACLNMTDAFYLSATSHQDEQSQFSKLERFGYKLLESTVATPQTIVDLLNERFWTLV